MFTRHNKPQVPVSQLFWAAVSAGEPLLNGALSKSLALQSNSLYQARRLRPKPSMHRRGSCEGRSLPRTGRPSILDKLLRVPDRYATIAARGSFPTSVSFICSPILLATFGIRLWSSLQTSNHGFGLCNILPACMVTVDYVQQSVKSW